jgi:hypothetical protein
VLLWYAALRRAKSVVGVLRRAHRLWFIGVFVDPPLSTFFSLLFLFVSFGMVLC